MTKKDGFLIIQSALCVLIAVLLSAAAIRIYLEGSAWQAAGHPSEWIYTREKAAAAIAPVIPLILISAAVTIAGLIMGIKDENKDKPVMDEEFNKMAAENRDFNKAGPEKAKKRITIRRILYAVAICFVVMGIFNGSMRDVLVKAIKICTECVGLG